MTSHNSHDYNNINNNDTTTTNNKTKLKKIGFYNFFFSNVNKSIYNIFGFFLPFFICTYLFYNCRYL